MIDGMRGMAGMNMPTDMPSFTFGRALEFGGDPFFLTGCLLALALYGWAVVRLRAARRPLAGRAVAPPSSPVC